AFRQPDARGMMTDLPIAARVFGSVQDVDLAVPHDRGGVERGKLLPPHDRIVRRRAERGAGIGREDGVRRPGPLEGAERPDGLLRARHAGERAEQAQQEGTGLATDTHLPSLPPSSRKVKLRAVRAPPIAPSGSACIIDRTSEQGDPVNVKRNDWSRREFLGTSAAAAGASLAAQTIGPVPQQVLTRPSPGAASDRVRFGMIGIGMQGSGLLANAIMLPGVECAGAADLYDGRHTLAREIVRADLPVTRRYQELLDNKDIDCIVAAVPDHWHKQVVVDAVSAGKDIYCEKPMSHTPADGVAMVEAANGRAVS